MYNIIALLNQHTDLVSMNDLFLLFLSTCTYLQEIASLQYVLDTA